MSVQETNVVYVILLLLQLMEAGAVIPDVTMGVSLEMPVPCESPCSTPAPSACCTCAATPPVGKTGG